MILTVRDCCVPRQYVLQPDGRADIEDIALSVSAAEEDADAFFALNHVTAGMRLLFETGLARLDGRSQQADFLLAQAMGGGKTHLMVSFALIAKSPAVRQRVLDAAGINIRTGFGAARVVAFSGRNNPDHYFWGEIARQLGKGDTSFNRHWLNGPKGPDKDAWIDLIGDEPAERRPSRVHASNLQQSRWHSPAGDRPRRDGLPHPPVPLRRRRARPQRPAGALHSPSSGTATGSDRAPLFPYHSGAAGTGM